MRHNNIFQILWLIAPIDNSKDTFPPLPRQVEDLKWEVERKEREIETLKQQLDMSEQRSHKELEGIQAVLQVFNLAGGESDG